jgi:serine/threonine protein kinase
MDALAKACPKCGRRYDTAAAFCQKDGERLQLTEEEEDRYIGATLLDQFKIEEKIGAGGMGSVYRARQTTLHRDVAIKILHPELADNRDAVRRFKREARVCTALDHPNVVRVFLFGQLPDGSLYIVMEFLRGRSLLDVLAREGSLPVHRSLHIASQICDGVGEAHAHGVVHRDIKPENIVLVAKSRDPDTVKVLDFGIARVLWGDDQTQATQSGLVFGTARYISPEGAAGEPTDARSDVYSLGVLTYQLLCGETPFDAPSPVAMLMKHIHATPPHLLSQERARHVPEPVADVVMRALSKNAEGRYDDAQSFGEALRAAAESAGFEVNVRRPRSSISPSSPPASVSASASVPPSITPVLADTPAVADSAPDNSSLPPIESSTLSGAPNPFGENEDVSLPNYQAKKTGSSGWRIVAAAFVFGILLVGGAFAAVRFWPRGETPEVRPQPIAEWLTQARAALVRGQYDDPREGSVLELTDRILEHDADNAAARTLRDDAAARLVREARAQAEGGERDEARATYTRALAFRPDDAAILSARTALEEAPPAEVPPGVRTTPLHILEGQPVTLSAVLQADAEIGARTQPRFVLRRGEDRVGGVIVAIPMEGGRSFQAQHTFESTGRYRLVFRIGSGADRIEMSTDIEVHRDPSRVARPRPPQRDPPATIIQGGNWGEPNIAPAWTNTPVVENHPPPAQEPPPPPPPPAPWTGSVL